MRWQKPMGHAQSLPWDVQWDANIHPMGPTYPMSYIPEESKVLLVIGVEASKLRLHVVERRENNTSTY